MPLRRRSTGSSATSTPADRRASSSRSTRSTQRFSSGAASGCYVDIYELSPGARVARSLPVCWPCGVASTCARVRFARPVGSSACGTPVDAVTADGPTVAARAISLLGLRGASDRRWLLPLLASLVLIFFGRRSQGSVLFTRSRHGRARPSAVTGERRDARALTSDLGARWPGEATRRGDGGEVTAVSACMYCLSVACRMVSVGGT